jgi:hypothetical protein
MTLSAYTYFINLLLIPALDNSNGLSSMYSKRENGPFCNESLLRVLKISKESTSSAKSSRDISFLRFREDESGFS